MSWFFIWAQVEAAAITATIAQVATGSAVQSIVATQSVVGYCDETSTGDSIEALAASQSQTATIAQVATGSAVESITANQSIVVTATIAQSASGSSVQSLSASQTQTMSIAEVSTGSSVQAIVADTFDGTYRATCSQVATGAAVESLSAEQVQTMSIDQTATGQSVEHLVAQFGDLYRSARMQLQIVSQTPLPYGGRVQIQFDVEHPTQSVTFGVERLGADDSEYSYEYGVDANIERLSESYYADGESYIFTSEPVLDGTYVFEARSDFGMPERLSYLVWLPENSKMIRTPPP